MHCRRSGRQSTLWCGGHAGAWERAKTRHGVDGALTFGFVVGTHLSRKRYRDWEGQGGTTGFGCRHMLVLFFVRRADVKTKSV